MSADRVPDFDWRPPATVPARHSDVCHRSGKTHHALPAARQLNRPATAWHTDRDHEPMESTRSEDPVPSPLPPVSGQEFGGTCRDESASFAQDGDVGPQVTPLTGNRPLVQVFL